MVRHTPAPEIRSRERRRIVWLLSPVFGGSVSVGLVVSVGTVGFITSEEVLLPVAGISTAVFL